jgi:hypothetical protein
MKNNISDISIKNHNMTGYEYNVVMDFTKRPRTVTPDYETMGKCINECNTCRRCLAPIPPYGFILDNINKFGIPKQFTGNDMYISYQVYTSIVGKYGYSDDSVNSYIYKRNDNS